MPDDSPADINPVIASAYASGRDPIVVAELRIAALLSGRDLAEVRADAGLPPRVGWQDVSNEAMARKILGFLLDAGWREPSGEVLRAAVEHRRGVTARREAWWSSLTEGERRRFIDHCCRTGEHPADLTPPAEGAS